jgi:hypothetical protein
MGVGADRSQWETEPSALPWCVHYDLQVDLQTEPVQHPAALCTGTLAATCHLRLRNPGPLPVVSLPFLLYRLLEVRGVRWNSAPVPWVQKLMGIEGLSRWQVISVEAPLSSPLDPGEEGLLTVEYGGPICGYREVVPYIQDGISPDFTLLRRDDVLFVPVLGAPSLTSLRRIPDERFTYQLAVTTDPAMTAVTAGEGESRLLGSRRLHEWRNDDPDWRLDLAVGQYGVVVSSEWPGVRVFPFVGDEEGAQLYLRVGANVTALLTDWFGPTCSRLNVIAVPAGYGGQASPTHILAERESFVRKAGETERQAYERLLGPVAHEIIHRWNVPSREVMPSRFLDEGITHYLETVVARTLLGCSAWARRRVEEYRAFFRNGGDEAERTPLARAGRSPVREAIARGKGPWLLTVWEDLVGLDVVLESLRAFFEKHRSTGATLDDFAAAVRASGQGFAVESFLNDWIYTAESSGPLASGEDASALAGRYR